jgi:uncharacterized Zn-binding protein involved in type VI secretion
MAGLSTSGSSESGLAESAPSASASQTPASAPAESRGARRRLPPRAVRAIAVIGALAMLLSLAVAIPRMLNATAGPERAAREVLQALVDGDTDAFLEHVATAPDAGRATLTAEILDAAEDRVRRFEIDAVEVEGATATVTATLDNGHETTGSTLTLHASSASAFAPVTWVVDPLEVPEAQVAIPLGISSISVNGVPVPVAGLVTSAAPFAPGVAMQLLPGTYEITLPEAERWMEPVTATVEIPPVLGTWRTRDAVLEYELAADGTEEVRRQVDAMLETCAGSTSPVPADCPFAVPGVSAEEAADPSRQGTWSITAQPALETRPFGNGLWDVHADGGTVEFTPSDPEAGQAPQSVPIELTTIAYLRPDGELSVENYDETGFGFAVCRDEGTGEITGQVLRDDSGRSTEELCR